LTWRLLAQAYMLISIPTGISRTRGAAHFIFNLLEIVSWREAIEVICGIASIGIARAAEKFGTNPPRLCSLNSEYAQRASEF
jgi:hypothetical protein